MNRQSLVKILKSNNNYTIKSFVVWAFITVLLLLLASVLNVLILVRIFILILLVIVLCFLFWRFVPALISSPGSYVSSASIKLLTKDISPVMWVYLSQLTRTQYGSSISVEKDLVIGLKNKRLIKINYSFKGYNFGEEVKFDINELAKFVETELLDKQGRVGHSIENARWFTESKFN